MPKNSPNTNPADAVPGYRTRSAGMGLDPVASYREAGYMQGVFLRDFFSLRLRTRNWAALLFLFLIGVFPGAFALVAMIAAVMDSGSSRRVEIAWSGVLIFLIVLLLTAIATINFTLSILEITGQVPPLPPRRVQAAARKPARNLEQVQSTQRAEEKTAPRAKTSSQKKRFKK